MADPKRPQAPESDVIDAIWLQASIATLSEGDWLDTAPAADDADDQVDEDEPDDEDDDGDDDDEDDDDEDDDDEDDGDGDSAEP